MAQELTFCTYSSIKPIAAVTAGCFLEISPLLLFTHTAWHLQRYAYDDLIKAHLGVPLHKKHTFNEKQMKPEVISGSLPVNEQITMDAHVFRQRH